ncbi:gamma-glutamylcyclotransferase family protein [Streptomyces sp.]|uniref:gamma-glutamylcyclotransferase family protein n=1 Tax=Streptomyces sp. TaxID=1931 RepID=UPI002F41D765
MTPRHLPVFVYGTLLPGERNHHLLHGRTVSWTPAVLPGTLLFHGPGYPYAVPDPDGAGTVHGEVAVITEEVYGQVLAELDRLEDYVPGNAANLYERVAVQVRTPGGEVHAWVYIAADRITRELLVSGVRIEDGDWLRRPVK